MMIGNVEITTTKQQERKLMRKHTDASRMLNFKCATTFSGPIGKQLQECDIPEVTFQSIEGNFLPNIDPNELITDQKYLLEIC